MNELEGEIETIRVNAMKRLADSLKEDLRKKYDLRDEDISISMFGSQTILSDFDMHIFLKNSTLKNLDETDRIDELNLEIDNLVERYFKNSFDETLKEYRNNVKNGKIGQILSDEILEVINEYDPKKTKGICDFYVGSLEDLIDQGKIPIGKPSDKEDYRRGYRGRAPNVKMKFIAKTHKHLSGRDVSEYIERGASEAGMHPSEGYEKYIIETRNIAYGFLNEDGRSISKSLVEIAHAIYIISGEGVLSAHEDKLHMGERVLGHFLTSPHYKKIIKDSLDIKRGLDEKYHVKKEFDWEKLKEDIILEDGNKTNVTGIDCLWSMFDYLSRLFKKTVYETGYINDDKLKNNISDYLNQTSQGLINSIIKLEKEGKEVDPRFLLFYIDELINNDYSPYDDDSKLFEKLSSSLKTDTITDVLTKARIEVYLGNYASAESLFEELLSGNKIQDLINKRPWDLSYSYRDLEPDVIISSIYKEYSRALVGINKNDEAKNYLFKAIELNPLNHELWENLANIHKCERDEQLSKEYTTIANQLKNNEYDIFEWQKLKAKEIKNLFKYWKANFNKNIKKHADISKRDYDKLLSATISAYNSLDGWNVAPECYARIEQLNVICNFTEEGIMPLLILDSIQEKINPFLSIEYALPDLKNGEDQSKGMFPLYKTAMDIFFKQKRNKESMLMELDFVISDIKKEIANTKMASLDTDELNGSCRNIDVIKLLLNEGLVYIDAYEDVMNLYKLEGPSQDNLDIVNKKYHEVNNKMKNELLNIRISLEEQLSKYDCLSLNINSLHNHNGDSYALTCGFCGAPIFAIWENCIKCKNNDGLKSVGYKKEKITKEIYFDKNNFCLNSDNLIEHKIIQGYSEVDLKELPEQIKEILTFERILFGLLELQYLPKETSMALKGDYSTNSEGNHNAICRAYLKKDDKTDKYTLCLNQKIPEYDEIKSMQIYFFGEKEDNKNEK